MTEIPEGSRQYRIAIDCFNSDEGDDVRHHRFMIPVSKETGEAFDHEMKHHGGRFVVRAFSWLCEECAGDAREAAPADPGTPSRGQRDVNNAGSGLLQASDEIREAIHSLGSQDGYLEPEELRELVSDLDSQARRLELLGRRALAADVNRPPDIHVTFVPDDPEPDEAYEQRLADARRDAAPAIDAVHDEAAPARPPKPETIDLGGAS